MNVIAIIPVGPGHQQWAHRAEESVRTAWYLGHGPFDDLRVVLVPDPDGQLGRSRARNRGMDANPADWHFLLDADDRMLPWAFSLLDPTAAATFGAVCLDGKISRENRHPVTRRTLFEYGPRGTLSMGCFVRGDLGLRFNEDLDAAEDFDFYMRLPSFTKRQEPLVSIGYSTPSAGGPRAAGHLAWWAACDTVIARYAEAPA